MKLNNQDFLLDKTKKELEEAIKQSMKIGTFIAVGLIILTMILDGILYYNMLISFLIPFYKSFGEQSTEIFLERRILTNKISTDLFLYITNFNFLIITIILSIIMFLSYILSILKQSNLNQKIDEQKLKYYSQIIKTYFWPGALVWKIIGIIIVVYYGYIFANIYQILKGSSLIK
jgi:magnesium-transporting ATPase (P-type)